MPSSRARLLSPVEEYLELSKHQVAHGTWLHRRTCLGRFERFLKKQTLSLQELRPRHFDQFVRHLTTTVVNQQGEPIHTSRVQRHLIELRSFFRHLLRTQQLLTDHSLALSCLRTRRKKPLFVPTFRQVLELMSLPSLEKPIGLRDRAMMETAYGCGLRVGELVRLNLKDLDFDSQEITVRRGKGGRRRCLPMGPCVRHYLLLYLNQARPQLLSGFHDALWLNTYGMPFSSPNSAVIRMARCYESRLPFSISWHSLRRAFATHLLEGGANIRAVQMLLGHKCLNTTKIYAQVRPVALKRVHQQCHPRG